jgi:hypothetical protein
MAIFPSEPTGPGNGGGLSLSTAGSTIGKPVTLRPSGLLLLNASELRFQGDDADKSREI